MTVSIHTPIVTFASGDVEVYRSVEAACLYMEAIDVLDDVYEVFDSQGCRLIVGTEGDLVTIKAGSSESDIDDLARRLRDFVGEVGPDRLGIPDPNALSVDQLLEALLRSDEKAKRRSIWAFRGNKREPEKGAK